ncbi:alanyl-tRNA synthetase/misacylated tRNA(Ala) deacylase [Marinobacter sp. LV10MA510-1]|nr:alanyl-tRNA synthetase/misacylated tRNA(Ala) deacylase [Marinobacter sp. LV10MA510-1]PFG51548.1 alanyl-tRNA synthetase/misacylated tRNA(Ala) deacylase [Marinobacter sp. LV10R520-4]
MTKTSQTLQIFDDAPYQTEFTARVVEIRETAIALDKTLFYPTGGGQPGDIGHLLMPDGTPIVVRETFRDSKNKNLIWHEIAAQPEKIEAGLMVTGSINWERRYQHMKMHTCLHLLCAIVHAPVTGCSISPDKGRLDFDLPDTSPDKEVVTTQLNELINASRNVTIRRISADDNDQVQKLTRTQLVAPPVIAGAVRVVEIPGVDVQPCGGTHVRNTAEIGAVVCSKIEKKSRHNRRIIIRFA